MNDSYRQGLVVGDRQGYERRARGTGYSLIAGVDEVGRAAWAGPMVAAAVILNEDFDGCGIRSSKKMGPQSRLVAAYDRILLQARAVAVRQVNAGEIDTRGIDACHLELLRDAVGALDVEPDCVLVDYYAVPGIRQPQVSITNGDDLSVTIAAASIVAKVTCDRIMATYDKEYPDYGFAENKGYHSDEHKRGLDRLGPSPIHRRSVSPVKRRLQGPQ